MRFISCLARFQHLLVSLAFLLMILIGIEPGLAQSPPATSKPQHQPHQPPPAVDQEQFLSYWTTENGWRTELELRNNQVAQELTVAPFLRAADGTETPLSSVVIKPKEVKSIDLDLAIADAASPQLIGTYGSVVLRYRSTALSNLYAIAMIRRPGHSVVFHVDGIGESQDFQEGSREGIWWLPNNSASDYLVLVNQSQNPLSVDFSLFDAAGKSYKQKLTLAPRAANRLSVRQLATAAGLTGSYGGIKVSTTAHAGSLDTLHFLFGEQAAFSAILKMFDYDPKSQIKEHDFAKTGLWTLRAPMLALSNPDPALAFPVGTTLSPQLFVRNTTPKPIDATVVFNWRGDSGTGKASGPVLHLNPYETRRIDVAYLQDAKTLPQNARWTSVTLSTNGLPNEVVAVAASYDQTLRYGAQTPFSDQLASHWAGSTWEYDAQHNSIITVGNGGTQPTQAAFTLFYNQGTQKYELEQTLRPDEQMWVDVGKLIREQVPDKNGKALPSDVASGSYEIRETTLQTTQQRLGTLFEGKVIYDRTYGHVTYGCAICCGYATGFVLTFNPLPIPLPGQAPNGVDAFSSCDGVSEDVSDYFWGGWSTAYPSIATVNYYGTHTAVAVGSTNVLSTGSPPGTNQRTWCPPIARQVSGGDNVTPTISVSCTPTELELGPYPPPSTTSGSCSTTVNPSGGTYSWSVNKNTISLSAGTNSATYSAANPSQSQGDTIVSVTYTVNGQSATAQSNGITTHNPTSLAVTGDNFYPTGWACSGTNSVECIIGNGTCSPSAGLCSYNGPLRIRSYDVHDQLNQPFTALGLTLVNISESVTVSTTCPDVGQPVLASSPSTPFSDKLAMCSRCCLPGGQNCTTTTAPTQAILANGNVVRSEIITWTCTSISLNP